jgi:hypothetical protein
METLTSTQVASDAPVLPNPRPMNLGAFFAQKDRLVRWCLLTSIGSIGCAILSLVTALSVSKRDIRFVVLDPAGNVFVAPGRAFDEAKELHIEQALLATSALLLRQPNDFDLPELLQTLFAPRSHNEAMTLKSREHPEFQLKQIHQKPLVSRVEALEVRPNAVRLQVSGQLLRTGSFQGQPMTEVIPFVLDLVLQHNLDLLRNRRQPTVVNEFSLRYETAR